MPISHKYKAILIHIPKNAGENMEKKLGMYGQKPNLLDTLWGIHGEYVLQHLTMIQMRRHFITEDIFNEYYKFAFVRNPWDKAVSEYYWYLRYGSHMDFREWVRTLPGRLRISTNLHLLEVGHNIPQYKYIYDENMELLVNFVGKFEHLKDDFESVCKTIGIEDQSLPQLQSTSAIGRKHYTTYYTDETKDIIATVYETDIELFGYEF